MITDSIGGCKMHLLKIGFCSFRINRKEAVNLDIVGGGGGGINV